MRKIDRLERWSDSEWFAFYDDYWAEVLDKVDVADVMVKYGWWFISSLGNALYRADHINEYKIINTWHDDICKELSLYFTSKEWTNTDSEW